MLAFRNTSGDPNTGHLSGDDRKQAANVGHALTSFLYALVLGHKRCSFYIFFGKCGFLRYWVRQDKIDFAVYALLRRLTSKHEQSFHYDIPELLFQFSRMPGGRALGTLFSCGLGRWYAIISGVNMGLDGGARVRMLLGVSLQGCRHVS